MNTESYNRLRFRRFMLNVLAVAQLGAWSVALSPQRAHGGTLVIPAWSFDRGTGQIHADGDKYADAGPLVVNGPRAPWGWSVEYDINFPVKGGYTLQICYATEEVRPVQVFFDSKDMGKCCTRVSLSPATSKTPNIPTFKSSGATWQTLRNRFGRAFPLSGGKGKHKLVLTSQGPLPNLVALKLQTAAPFPDDWQPPKYKVRDIDSVPAKYRKAFDAPAGVDVAALRAPVKPTPEPRPAGTLQIPAWTFDRGNVMIYASPDKYADAGPVVGSAPEQKDGGVVEYDIEFAADGQSTLHVNYTSAEARPVKVFLDDKFMGMTCVGATPASAPYEQPVVFTSNSSGAPKRWEGFCKDGKLVRMPVTKGKHTLKLTRKGPMPNLLALRVGSSSGFPKASPRKMPHYDKVPVKQRSVFLHAGAVNIAALRESIQDMTKTFGSQYPRGSEYLKHLDELDKKPRTIVTAPKGRVAMARVWAGEEGKVPAEQETEMKLEALQRTAMLAHPALKTFDKLLFLKRKPQGGHIYEGHMQRNKNLGSSLCILSPVSPDGKVTDIAPQLAGGLFSRFDLSYDGKKVVFGYRTKDTPFHIYEMDIDPATGIGVAGSVRQLTGVPEAGKDAFGRAKAAGKTIYCGFNDSDPVYLPNGKIAFVSSRSRQNVFCFPATVTNLYVMDADGKNVRRLSSGPLTEMGPSVLDDGRVAYTRWEYVDKGLGNGQGLWMVRPDGSHVDHLYKNSITRPSGMLTPRSIPGSRRFVAVGCSHMSRQGGPVILVDISITRRSTEAMTCITPEIGYPCMYTANWGMGYFLDPHPFSEKFFLISHVPGAKGPKDKPKYGLYALDAWGNRAKLYGDPKISCFLPTPLVPRLKPTQIAGVKPVDTKKEERSTMFVQDIYQGMTGIERGRVKYVRVMGVLPWPTNENGMFRIGMAGNVHRKKVYGVAKVRDDGSAFFTVPARENIFFQALDENYLLLQHMPTFINVMPGEDRSCIGCHEHRNKAPGMARGRPEAMKYPIEPLAPQPGETGPRMIHYASDVQPVLNKHCIGCHSGSKPKAGLDLTGVPTETWNRSYENILGRGLVSTRQCGFGRSGFRPAPPLTFGSHLSKLTAKIRSASCKGKITQGEFVRIITWIDANSPYYGTYRGKRGLQDKDAPDFRMPPLVMAKPK
ncbi:MAG: hypothetical protein QGH60_13515 [Phycisphaerae bacterium]|jgi:hypothetical protein|nr:hypothetical protein [Phycisphaerae bacterium]